MFGLQKPLSATTEETTRERKSSMREWYKDKNISLHSRERKILKKYEEANRKGDYNNDHRIRKIIQGKK